jgi:hypothetical protein
MTSFYGTSISGWSCSVNCQIVNIPVMCTNFGLPCTNNYTQGIDLDSNNQFELVRQPITISTAGSYIMTVEYMCAVTNPVGKSFRVSFNGSNMNCACLMADYGYLKAERPLNLLTGSSFLDMFMTGSITGDSNGIIISGIYLRRIIPNSEINTTTNSTSNNTTDSTSLTLSTEIALMSDTIFNNLTTTLNKIPGSRIFFHTLSGYMLTFDRLQFYYYHRNNLTFYSELLLGNVDALAL